MMDLLAKLHYTTPPPKKTLQNSQLIDKKKKIPIIINKIIFKTKKPIKDGPSGQITLLH